MVATRGRTFKRPWRRSCLSSKLKSSSAPIGRKDSWCFHAVGSSNAPLLGSTAAEGLPRIGRTSIATRWRSCGLPQSASCSENFVIPPDVFGQTLSLVAAADREMTQEYSTCLEKSNGVTIEMINCILAETIRQDARLNENYKRLISTLAIERKNALVEAQRAWIRFRDANCGFYADPEGGSAARVTAHECLLNATVDRAKELRLLANDQLP